MAHFVLDHILVLCFTYRSCVHILLVSQLIEKAQDGNLLLTVIKHLHARFPD